MKTATRIGVVTSLCVSTANAREAGFLVFNRTVGKNQPPRLEAVRPQGATPRLLRAKSYIPGSWDISRDGGALCFGANPADFQVFASTREIRTWLFMQRFDQRTPLIVINPYKPPSTIERGLDYENPSWSPDGRQILVSEGASEDYYSVSWVSLLDAATKSKLWDSQDAEKTLTFFVRQQTPVLPNGRPNFNKQILASKISPDGKHVVCLAKTSTQPGTDVGLGESDWGTYLLHIDRETQSVDTLLRFDTRPFSHYDATPSFDWHPDGVRFAFSLGSQEINKKNAIYVGNWKTGEVKPLTQNASRNVNPVWINGGRQLVWLSDRMNPGGGKNHFFQMNADGLGQKQILKNLSGVANLRYVSRLPNWSRFKNADITPRMKPKR